MNSVAHFEIPSKNLSRAKTFYAKVFGWKMNDFDNENTMVSTTDTSEDGMPTSPGAINGSIYLPDKPKTVTVVINVDNIREHISIVEKNGGKLVDDVTTIPGMGMYARFEDTEGNLIGLWQNLA
jgi:uncharacterized protein